MNTITTRTVSLMAIIGLAGLLSACGMSTPADVATADAGKTTAVSAPTTVTAQAPAAQTEAVVSQQAPAATQKTVVTTAPTAVVQAPTVSGRAALTWTPPTENTDGSALANLAGYRVYFGSSASALTQKVDITNAGLTAYVLENLPAGTTYFAVAAINSAGVESAVSSLGSKTIS